MNPKTPKVYCIFVINQCKKHQGIDNTFANCILPDDIEQVRHSSSIENMINKLKPDLIILGLNNNQNTGLDALSRIRSISSLPLITISLNHDSVLDIKSILRRDDSHLTKSIKQMELAVRDRRYIKKSNLHFA